MGGQIKRDMVDYLRQPTLRGFINMTRGGLGVDDVTELLGGRVEVPLGSTKAAIEFYDECIKGDIRWLQVLTMDSLMDYLRYTENLTPEEDELLYKERPIYTNTDDVQYLKKLFTGMSNVPEGLEVDQTIRNVHYGSLYFVMKLILLFVMKLILLNGKDNYGYWTFKGNKGLVNCINEWEIYEPIDAYIIETFTRYLLIQYTAIYGKGITKIPLYEALNNQLTKAEQYLGARERVSDTLPVELQSHKQSSPLGIFNKIKEIYIRLTKTVTHEEI